MYSPVLSRFQSRDPLPLEGQADVLYGDTWIKRNIMMRLKAYTYVDNNPVTGIDPSGLQPAAKKKTPKTCVECQCEGVNTGVGETLYPTRIVNCGAEPPAQCCAGVCSGMAWPGEMYWYKGFKLLPQASCYTGVFLLCNRPIQYGAARTWCDTAAIACANVVGHEYLWYEVPGDDDMGWGLHGSEKKGDLPRKELSSYGKPTSCFKCYPNESATLKHGVGKGKTVKVAGESAILDCIANAPARADYGVFTYSCFAWAEETAKECGLSC